MFKKKVLSSILAMSLIFSTGSFASAKKIEEIDNVYMSFDNCKKVS